MQNMAFQKVPPTQQQRPPDAVACPARPQRAGVRLRHAVLSMAGIALAVPVPMYIYLNLSTAHVASDSGILEEEDEEEKGEPPLCDIGVVTLQDPLFLGGHRFQKESGGRQ